MKARSLVSFCVRGISWKLASSMPGVARRRGRQKRRQCPSPPFPPLSYLHSLGSPIVLWANALPLTNGVLNYLPFPYKELWHCLLRDFKKSLVSMTNQHWRKIWVLFTVPQKTAFTSDFSIYRKAIENQKLKDLF